MCIARQNTSADLSHVANVYLSFVYNKDGVNSRFFGRWAYLRDQFSRRPSWEIPCFGMHLDRHVILFGQFARIFSPKKLIVPA